MVLNKAVILAGGRATRLNPVSIFINKHLLPIYNQPMIYYSINFIKNLNINNILIICNEKDLHLFKKLKKEFPKINLKFKIQKNPKGIADGLGICKNYVGNDKFLILLGDNLFFFKKNNIKNFIKKINDINYNSIIFTSKVKKPNQFGIISIKNNKRIIIEKPRKPQNNKAVIGLYIYDKNCFNFLKKIKSSKRGELEITDINNIYMQKKSVNEINLDSLSIKWFDIGSFESYYSATVFMKNKSA